MSFTSAPPTPHRNSLQEINDEAFAMALAAEEHEPIFYPPGLVPSLRAEAARYGGIANINEEEEVYEPSGGFTYLNNEPSYRAPRPSFVSSSSHTSAANHSSSSSGRGRAGNVGSSRRINVFADSSSYTAAGREAEENVNAILNMEQAENLSQVAAASSFRSSSSSSSWPVLSDEDLALAIMREELQQEEQNQHLISAFSAAAASSFSGTSSSAASSFISPFTSFSSAGNTARSIARNTHTSGELDDSRTVVIRPRGISNSRARSPVTDLDALSLQEADMDSDMALALRMSMQDSPTVPAVATHNERNRRSGQGSVTQAEGKHDRDLEFALALQREEESRNGISRRVTRPIVESDMQEVSPRHWAPLSQNAQARVASRDEALARSMQDRYSRRADMQQDMERMLALGREGNLSIPLRMRLGRMNFGGLMASRGLGRGGDVLDVDNMSYEELQELGDRIGKVKKDGADESALSTLPTFTYHQSESKNETSGGDGRSCCICLTDFESGDEVKVLPCIHTFHASCVDQWLLTKNQCPTCQTVATSVNVN